MKGLLALVGVLILFLWLVLRTTAPKSAQNSPYADIIQHASEEYNVPQDWIAAVISTESSWNPDAKGGAGEIGLMQILPSTARGLGFAGDDSDLFDPDLNVHLGTKLLQQLKGKYGVNLSLIYSAYNSGDPDRYLKSTEVAQHVNNFLSNYRSITGVNA